jgi:putative NADH-flavin reductase
MVAVFGADGAIGKAVSAEAKRRRVPVRVVGRSAATLRFGFSVEIFALMTLAPADVAVQLARVRP